MFCRSMMPAWALVPEPPAWAVTRASICTSPGEGWLISRKESLVPPTPDPPADTVHVPLATFSDPAGAGLPMSWQVDPAGQLGSGGRVFQPMLGEMPVKSAAGG